MKKTICICLECDLIDRIDKEKGLATRSRVIERALTNVEFNPVSICQDLKTGKVTNQTYRGKKVDV